MSYQRIALCLLFMAAGLQGSKLHAGIMNGDFLIDLAGWDTDTGFSAPVFDGGRAKFEVTDFNLSLDRQLSRSIGIGGTPQSISFEMEMRAMSGGTGGGSLADFFQATLLDSAGNSLFPITPSILDAFYQADPSPFHNTSLVSVDAGGGLSLNSITTVTLDLTSLDVSLLPTPELIIDFQLIGDDDSLTTTVFIDNVTYAESSSGVIPEPTSMAIWGVMGMVAVVGRRRKRK